jgi:hypothetical protein
MPVATSSRLAAFDELGSLRMEAICDGLLDDESVLGVDEAA